MISYPKPIVLASHGLVSHDSSSSPLGHGLLRRLSRVAFVRTVCPPVELGIDAPQEALRLVLKPRAKLPRLIDTGTGEDLTEALKRFRKGFCGSLGDVDGFVFEPGSPTCALNDAPVFRADEKEPFATRPGIFSELLLKKWPHVAAQDQSTLRDAETCHRFLTAVYTMARFRGVRVIGTGEALARFHRDHEVLLNVYDAKATRSLAKLSLAKSARALNRNFKRYGEELAQVLAQPVAVEPALDALYAAVESLASRLTLAQRSHFFSAAERYANGASSLGEVLPTIRSWIDLFGEGELRRQTFFRPYPSDLLDPLGLEELVSRSGSEAA